jgi:hypothetical protein
MLEVMKAMVADVSVTLNDTAWIAGLINVNAPTPRNAIRTRGNIFRT